MGHNYYSVLGVTRNASNQEIKRAFRELALMTHVDRQIQHDDETDQEFARRYQEAAERFKEVAEAYRVLNDPVQRRLYDRGFEAVNSVQDFLVRDPTAKKIVNVLRETAPAIAKPGIDTVQAVTVHRRILLKGGTVPVQICSPDTGEIEELLLEIPAGEASYRFCRLRGLGEPGYRGGDAGDLVLVVVPV